MQCNTVQSAYVSIPENIKVFLNLGSSQTITVFNDIAPSRLVLRHNVTCGIAELKLKFKLAKTKKN